ncbi:tubulin-binding prefolding complex subunit GIM4 [Saccharomyces cerevisiae]|nr:tubulin-binding prefolding complex subunit GIM4 [Saccharomyces cerevisiae]PTN39440.1 tubulin-binding prefolding complex subunit GIM4 [Saccharomyces cerevisiae]
MEQRNNGMQNFDLWVLINAFIKTLKDAEPTRKCYRMIGGALVESDVQTSLPILETKKENIEGTISKMKETLIQTAKEFEKWKKDNKIQVVKN